MNNTLVKAAALIAMISLPAMGDVSISVGASAPTYGTTLNFDEVGGPTGEFLLSDSWSDIGISSMGAGDGNNNVGNFNSIPGFGWLPDNNVFAGNFGIFIEFSTDITEFSAQVWDNGGPADFISGGMIAIAQNDGVDVGTFFWETPVFGTAGDNWFDITTSGGDTFDRVVFVGFAFVSPLTIIDNISFNTVPAPSASLVLGFGLLGAARRRRA